MAGSVAPALALEYAALTSPFPSVFARARAEKTWNMFVDVVMPVKGAESALPVSVAESFMLAGANAAVGVPETTQVVPTTFTARPAGSGGAKVHAVSGRMPPVVGIA